MNAGLSHSIESHFGPPSEPVNIAEFTKYASNLVAGGRSVPDLQAETTEDEYSVADIRDALSQTWNNPESCANIVKNHDNAVASVYSASKSTKYRRKQNSVDPVQHTPVVHDIQARLNAVPLTSWKLPPDAASFMRSLKTSDQNTLTEIKATDNDALLDSPLTIITITVYNKVVWSPGHVSRTSQHVVHSSQSLRDLFDAIPCTSQMFPEEISEEGETVEFRISDSKDGRAVVCIEGLAYGDGMGHPDYADKLLRLTQKTRKNSPAMQKAPTTIDETLFSSLSLRTNEPYWLLHRGDCEHFFVVDQIRLHHPSDPSSGYPLTLQITPATLDLCRACAKVPAVWSIVGDVRLGESPCILCGPCWRNLGDSEDDAVLAVPLPHHEPSRFES